MKSPGLTSLRMLSCSSCFRLFVASEETVVSASVARFDFFSKLNLESASLGDSKLQVCNCWDTIPMVLKFQNQLLCNFRINNTRFWNSSIKVQFQYWISYKVLKFQNQVYKVLKFQNQFKYNKVLKFQNQVLFCIERIATWIWEVLNFQNLCVLRSDHSCTNWKQKLYFSVYDVHKVHQIKSSSCNVTKQRQRSWAIREGGRNSIDRNRITRKSRILRTLMRTVAGNAKFNPI